MKTKWADRHGRPQLTLGDVDGVGQLLDGERRVELELRRDEQLVGPEVLGAQVDDAAARSARLLEGLGDLGDVGLRRRLADQQALHLDRQDDGDDDEQGADGQRADGVPAGVAGGVGERRRRRGRTRGRSARRCPRAARPAARAAWSGGSSAASARTSCGGPWPPCTRCAGRSPPAPWRTAGSRWPPAAARPRAGGAASRCPRRGRTGRPSRTARGRRRRPRSSARGRTRTGGRCRRRGPPACRRAAAGAGCRCRPASGRPRRAGPAEPVMMKPTNLAMAMPRLARKAARIARRLPSCIGPGCHDHTRRASRGARPTAAVGARPRLGRAAQNSPVAMSRTAAVGSVSGVHASHPGRRHDEENTMAKYLLLKHYRGAPAPANDVPMDQWTPDEVEAHIQYMRDFAARLERDRRVRRRAGAVARRGVGRGPTVPGAAGHRRPVRRDEGPDRRLDGDRRRQPTSGPSSSPASCRQPPAPAAPRSTSGSRCDRS